MQFALAALTLGFLGSFHCVGMCGPIALALPLNRENWFTKLLSGLIYNSGRIFIYGSFGFLFGMLGKGFIIAGYQQALSVALGVFILGILLVPQKYLSGFTPTQGIFSFVSKIKSSLGKLFRQKSYSSMFLIGLLNGFLPCGLVYLGVAGAIATGSPVRGSLFMAMFGLGTLPAMLFVSQASQFISLGFRNKIRKLVPVFVGLTACILIIRGLNLGIPYLSPQLSKTDCTQHQCCHKK